MIGSDQVNGKCLCELCKEAPGTWVKPWKLYACKKCFLEAGSETLKTAMEVKEDE